MEIDQIAVSMETRKKKKKTAPRRLRGFSDVIGDRRGRPMISLHREVIINALIMPYSCLIPARLCGHQSDLTVSLASCYHQDLFQIRYPHIRAVCAAYRRIYKVSSYYYRTWSKIFSMSLKVNCKAKKPPSDQEASIRPPLSQCVTFFLQGKKKKITKLENISAGN